MSPLTKRILRITGWTVCLAAAVATVCAAYGGVVNPVVTTIPAILSMTFPFWLGLSAALLIAALLARARRMALVPLLGILCSAGPAASYTPVNLFRENVAERDSSRVFTL